MGTLKHKLILILVILLANVTFSKSGEPMYVQAIKTQLKKGPNGKSKSLLTLKRGQKVTLLEKKGIWFRVKAKKQEGWICRLFLSKLKPIGHADLMRDVDEDIAKANRRRPSNYSVSAATRGVMANERGRHGRQWYKSDYESLRAIEEFELKPKELNDFISHGNLPIEESE